MLQALINNHNVRTLAWFVAVLFVMASIALGLHQLLEVLDRREEEQVKRRENT